MIPDLIFQGFIGATPKNDIIYKALQDAYTINIDELSLNYHLLCYNLHNIIEKNDSDDKIHLYKEKWHKEEWCYQNCIEIFNDNNETVLLHYSKDKIIPK